MISWTTIFSAQTTQTYSTSFSSSWSSSRSSTGTRLDGTETVTDTSSTVATSSASSSASNLVDSSATQRTADSFSESGRSTTGRFGLGTPTTDAYSLPGTTTTFYRPTILLQTSTTSESTYTFYPTTTTSRARTFYTTSESGSKTVTALSSEQTQSLTTNASSTTEWTRTVTTMGTDTQYDPGVYATVYKATPALTFNLTFANILVEHEAIYSLQTTFGNGDFSAALPIASSGEEITVLPQTESTSLDIYDTSEKTTATLLFTTQSLVYNVIDAEAEAQTITKMLLEENQAVFPLPSLEETRNTEVTTSSLEFCYPFSSTQTEHTFTAYKLYDHTLWYTSAITTKGYENAIESTALHAGWQSTAWQTNGDDSAIITGTASSSDGDGVASSSSSSESHGTSAGGGNTFLPLGQICTTQAATALQGEDLIVGGGASTVQAPILCQLYGLGGFSNQSGISGSLEADLNGTVFFSPEEGQSFVVPVEGPPQGVLSSNAASSLFPGEFFFQSSNGNNGTLSVSGYNYTVTTANSETSESSVGEFSLTLTGHSGLRDTQRAAVLDYAQSFCTLGYNCKNGETLRELIRPGVYLATESGSTFTTSYSWFDTTFGHGQTRNSSHLVATPHLEPFTESFSSGKIAGVNSVAVVWTAPRNRVAPPPESL